MSYSTTILTSLFVFGACLTTNAQDYRSNYSPYSPNYGTTPTYQPQTPYLPGTSYQYAPSTYGRPSIWSNPTGLTQGCYGGRCNTVPSSTIPIAARNSCSNGSCGPQPYGYSRSYQTPWSGVNRLFGSIFPTNYGASTRPVQHSPLQLNVTSSPYRHQSTIPSYSTPRVQPLSSQPFYN